jgi:hypothetical protein
MNIVIVHGYAHRLMESGVVESAPVATSKAGGGSVLIDETGWQQRTPESMDLSGGDEFTIRETLERFSHIFVDDLERLAHAAPRMPVQVSDDKVL